MSPRVLWVGLLFAPAMPALADEKRKDPSGDELPAGMVARLGTVRLRGSAAEYTPEGTQIATSCADGVRFWDVKTGELRRHIAMKERPALLAFSPDDAKMAASRNGGIDVEVWDVAAGKRLHAFAAVEGSDRGYMGPRTHKMVFSADGKKLITGGDHFVWVLDLVEGKTVTLRGYAKDDKSMCNTVVASPDGRYLATGSDGRETVCLWDVATVKQVHQLKGTDRGLYSAAFSPDGKTLATGWSGDKVRLWSVETGKAIGTIKTPDCTGASVAFSPDGKALAVALNSIDSSRAGKQQILICDPGKSKVLKTIDAPDVRRVLFCPKGKTLAWESGGGAVTVLDARSYQELHARAGHRGPVLAVAWSPDGKWIATSGADNDIRIWDAKTQETVRFLRRHRDAVLCLAFSPASKLLVSGGRDENVVVWDVATGKHRWESDRHGNRVNAVAFSPDGKTVFAGGNNSAVHCWEASSGKHVRDLREKNIITRAMAVSPNGATLATGADDEVRLWDVKKGSVEAILPKGKRHHVTSLAISPDGKTLAIGCDRKLFVEDLKTGKEIKTLPGHSNTRGTLTFSPDGKYLASACDGWWDTAGKNLHVWDTRTWKDVRPAKFPEKMHVHSVAFAPDGKHIVVGTEDTTASVWKIAE